MVLRVHLHLLTMAAGKPHHQQQWVQRSVLSGDLDSPQQQPSGKKQTPDRQMAGAQVAQVSGRCSSVPFLALSIVRELFCIVSNLTHLGLCFFKFCLGRDVWEQQLHRVMGYCFSWRHYN